MQQILETLGAVKVIPVVVMDNVEEAVSICGALRDGGLPVAEITLRTPAALQAIETLSQELPDMLIGAGTVLTVDRARSAIDAGAKFVVSPGFGPRVVDFCLSYDIPVIPGCSTPTDLTMAVEFGLEVVKFFPAETLGGLPALKAMAAPFNMLQFVPTGGIDSKLLTSYLAYDKVLACGGSWMVKSEMVKSGDWEGITRLANEAAKIAAMRDGGEALQG